MGLECTLILMVVHIKGCGLMVNSMVKALSSLLKVLKEKESGKKEKELSGSMKRSI